MHRFETLAGRLLMAALISSGCTGNATPEVAVTTPVPTISTVAAGTALPSPPHPAATASTTQNSLDGNRIVGGSIDLPNASVLDIPVQGRPIWLAGALLDGTALFVAVMHDGTVQAFRISGQAYEAYPIPPSQLPAGMPPLLRVTDGEADLVLPPDDASSASLMRRASPFALSFESRGPPFVGPP